MERIAEYINALEALDLSEESDNENELNMQLLMPFLFRFDEEEDDFNLFIDCRLLECESQDLKEKNNMQMIQPVIEGVQRINHVKILNYVEHVARNYINQDFIMHFRLSRQVANELIVRFERSPMFTNLRVSAGFEPITSEKHILCYLWFVGHQTSSYRDVADRFGITLSCLYNIITRVTNFILSLAPTIIKYPTRIEKEETKAFYLKKKDFPGVIGSMDGSHIRIDKPLQDKDSYINRKHYFSIQLQGVVNHKKQFTDVIIGYPGSVHDARVFRESPLFNNLSEICEDGEYILADSAYPCLQNVIVPYRDNGHLNRAQIKFNTTLSSCRVTVENAFADLKQRFRQLYHFKLRNIVRMVLVIHACCVLHNLANAEDLDIFEPPIPDDYPDPEADNFQENEQQFLNNIPENGKIIRDELCRQIASR